jgi:formylglycine-generating enzyme required for sulfatase activity
MLDGIVDFFYLFRITQCNQTGYGRKCKPNACGIYGIISNIGECTVDCEHYGYNGAPTDRSTWIAGSTKGDKLWLNQ